LTQESSSKKAKKFIEEQLSKSWNDFSDEEKKKILSEVEEWFKTLDEAREQKSDPNLDVSTRGVSTSVKTFTDEQLTTEFLSYHDRAYAVDRPSIKDLLWLDHIAGELENRGYEITEQRKPIITKVTEEDDDE
jgi:hypothetical protein